MAVLGTPPAALMVPLGAKFGFSKIDLWTQHPDLANLIL